MASSCKIWRCHRLKLYCWPAVRLFHYFNSQSLGRVQKNANLVFCQTYEKEGVSTIYWFSISSRQFGLKIWVQEDKNPFAQYLQLNSRNWTNFYFWWNPALMPMWKICVLSQICEDWWSQMNHHCSPSAIKFSRLSGLWMTIDNYIKFTRLLFLSGRISYMRPAELELSRMIKGNCKVTQQGW